MGAYVCFPSAGQVYACRYGQEAVASSTQPGTNSTIWWPVTGLSGGFPTWVTGGTYHSAGPYHINGSTALHPYTEGGQGPSEAGISSVVVGGLHGSDNLGPRIFGSQGKVWLQGGFNSNDVSQLDNALWFSSNNSFQGGAGGGPGSLGFIYKNDTDGIVIYGGGTARDVTLLNRAGSYVFWISPNSTQANFGGTLAISGNAIVGGAVSSTSPTLGIGYATGAGGAVTQLTSKSTGVTINKICGRITTNASALASNTTVTFVVTNSALAASDVVSVALKSGNAAAGTYLVWTEAVSAGSFKINLRNISASSLSESLVLNFVVVKAVSA